jgi:site-specific DNA-methyltransferase (adenine-specific)
MHVHHNNCSELTNLVQPDSIDLTLSSPPYDSIRAYSGYDLNLTQLIKDLYVVTKNGGVVIWIVADETKKGTETGSSFKQALMFMENGWRLNDTMIYAKNNPMPTSGPRYQQSFEYCFCFSKGKPKTFNPITEKCKYTGKARMKNRGKNGKIEYRIIERTKTKKVGNIFYYSVGGGHSTQDKVAYDHPAIMPEALAHDQILTWSNKGDMILDPMAGSGTTLKVALELGREAIGIEISKDYCDIIKER